MILNYIRTSENAISPFKKHPEDADFELYVTWINEYEKYVEYGTNIVFEVPVGYIGLLFPIDSVINTNLNFKNSIKIITSTFREEITFKFTKSKSNSLYSEDNEYNVGDPVGQIIFLQIPNISLNNI